MTNRATNPAVQGAEGTKTIKPNPSAAKEAAGSMLGECGTVFITRTGRRIDYLNPDPDQIWFPDIVHSMARMPRYLGHTIAVHNWTVGDHLVLCGHICRLLYPSAPPSFQKAVFSHDFKETYVCDIPTPLTKALEALGAAEALRNIGDRVDRAIHAKLGIPFPLPDGWVKLIK